MWFFLRQFFFVCCVHVTLGVLPWDFEASKTVAATTVDIHGQGDTTIVVGDPTTNTVRLYNQNIGSNTVKHTLRQTLTGSASSFAGFGIDVSLGGNDVTGDLLLVGSNSASSNKIYSGAVYLYSGKNSKWSTQQMFTVPVNGIGNNRFGTEWTFFGAAVDLDVDTNSRFVVGCANCSAYNLDRGTIFLYEARDDTSSHFDQTESLEAGSSRLYGLGHTEVAIHGNTIVGIVSRDRDWMEGHSDALVFHRTPSGRWTEMQQLVGDASVTGVAVFDETILLASSEMTRFGYSLLGSIFVMYPNTERYALHDRGSYKPQPLQWSVHQILRTATTFASNLQYGLDVGVSGNNLAVTEKSTGKVFFYERESLSGRWSQQRQFVAATLGSSSVVAVEGSHVIVGDGTKFSTFADNRNEDCLIISVEDHFGDGWGNNSLVVESPGRDRELFAPDCDTENPLQFRYCPFQNTQSDGKYLFHMPKARDNAFHWEIVWRVYEEASGKWYVGNWDTKMEFSWDISRGGFMASRLDRLLPNNITCDTCPMPTNAPTAAPSKRVNSKSPTAHPSAAPGNLRHLKGSSGTLHPTVSPAPTLDLYSTRPWYNIYMTDDSNMAWFDAEHRGTNYYISDRYGHKLLKVGTMCPQDGASPHCSVSDLPDGEYIFRVGGALDRFKSTRNWWFCGRVNAGGPQTQFSFRVSDMGRTCTITAHYTYTTYCRHVGDYDVVLRFVVGLDVDTSLVPLDAFLGADDKEIIENAFKRTFSSLHVNSVTVVGVQDYILTVDVGFQPRSDVFQSEETFKRVIDQLTSDVVSVFVSRKDYFSHFFASNPRLSSPMHYVTVASLISLDYGDISGVDAGEQKEEWSPSDNSNYNNAGDDAGVVPIGGGSLSSTGNDHDSDASRDGGFVLLVASVCGVLSLVVIAGLYLMRKLRSGAVVYEILPMGASGGTGRKWTSARGDSGSKSPTKRPQSANGRNSRSSEEGSRSRRTNKSTRQRPQNTTIAAQPTGIATSSVKDAESSRSSSRSWSVSGSKFLALKEGALGSSSSSDTCSDSDEDDSGRPNVCHRHT